MIEYKGFRPKAMPFAAVVGAAIATAHMPYPPREPDSYVINSVKNTHSAYMAELALGHRDSLLSFAQQMVSIYSSLASRQERLGEEFEHAIYSDLESLYEA